VVVVSTTRIVINRRRQPYGPDDRALVGIVHAARARSAMSACPQYRATPLRSVPRLARSAGVAEVEVKDESDRFGLGSFKALGGAYAVTSLAAASPTRTVFVCASAGNHGLSVAAGARTVGCGAQVWLGRDVPAGFEDRLRALGADVRRADGDYEHSLRIAVAAAARPGHRLVADTSWEGYTAVPLQVMRGYAVLAHETAESDRAVPPSHVFVQAGVGGLAGAIAGYLRDRWGGRSRIVVVEPRAAACLAASAAAGTRTRSPAGGRTSLGRLDCRQPSLLGWQLLSRLADAFITITDEQARDAAAALAAEGVRLSPCGAAGAAGLLAASAPAQRRALGLDPGSRVLLIGTERAADGA
jgi:diaminopropionate ammonia-lyase